MSYTIYGLKFAMEKNDFERLKSSSGKKRNDFVANPIVEHAMRIVKFVIRVVLGIFWVSKFEFGVKIAKCKLVDSIKPLSFEKFRKLSDSFTLINFTLLNFKKVY